MAVNSRLKLYRGISAAEFELLTPSVFKNSRITWQKILKARTIRNFAYPDLLDKEILHLSKVARLERQHFTDNKVVALGYARKTKGMLIQLEVPVSDLRKYFRLEFQNFGRRKKSFEIVYVVDARLLAKHQRSWKLKTNNLS